MANDERRAIDIAQQFKKMLDAHGLSFQRRVWKIVGDLEGTSKQWAREAFEFPVSLGPNTKSTSIDLLLRHTVVACFLVVECKRANPALANWCFARGPYSRTPENAIVYERVLQLGQVDLTVRTVGNVYAVALEIRTGQRGDMVNRGRGEIDDAVAQAVKGCNALIDRWQGGLVELWARSVKPITPPSEDRIAVIPMVVTTARLWVSDVDLATADVFTGTLPQGSVAVQPAPWLYYRFHATPDLRHHLAMKGQPSTLRDFLNRDYARTVPIVSAEGLPDFLEKFEREL